MTVPRILCEVDFEDDPHGAHYDIVQSFSPGAYYRLGETTGTTANDSSGNARHGTYEGGFTLNQTSVIGDGDGSVALNGSTGDVVMTSSAFQSFGTGNYTISAWIYPTATRSASATDAAGIVCYEYAGSHIPFVLAYGREDAVGATLNQVWGGYYVTSTGWHVVEDALPIGTEELNRWTHYAMVVATQSVALYRDGVRVTGPTGMGNNWSASGAALNTRIGRRWDTGATGTDEFFPGRIDEVAFFPRALADADIAKLFVSGAVRRHRELNYVNVGMRANGAQRVRSFATRAGRQTETDRVEAAQATVALDNRDGVLSPDPIANYVNYPSFEGYFWSGVQKSPAGWSCIGNGTLAVDTAQVRTGKVSGKVTSAVGTNPTVISYQSSYSVGSLHSGTAPGRQYTVSCYVYVPSGVGIALADVTLVFGDSISGSVQESTSGNPGAFDSWQRISVTRTVRQYAEASRFEIRLANGGAAGRSIWVDDVQLEDGSAATTYVDGDQTDCRWGDRKHYSVTHKKTTDGYRNVLPGRRARLRAQWGAEQLVPNGGFERGTVWPWTVNLSQLVTTSVDIDTAPAAPRGKYRWKVTPTGANAQSELLSDYIVVDTATQWTLSALFMRDTANANGLAIRLYCYDEYRRYLGLVYANQDASGMTRPTGAFNTASTGTWERFGGTYNGTTGTDGGSSGGFISGTRWVRASLVGAFNPGVGFSGSAWIDACQLTPGLAYIPDADYLSDSYFTLVEGTIDRWRWTESVGDHDATVEIEITDGFKALTLQNLSSFTRPAESVETRVAATLLAAGIPTEKQRILNVFTFYNVNEVTALSVSPLEHIREMEETERGVMLFDGDVATYQGLSYRGTLLPVATFTDAPSAANRIPYRTGSVEINDSLIANYRILTNEPNATTFYAFDYDSIRRFFSRTASVGQQWDSNVVVWSSQSARAQPRLEVLTVSPESDSSLWPLVLGLRLGDQVVVERHRLRDIDAMRGYLQHIEAVTHTGTPAGWETAFTVSPTFE